ncbi:hypothetical protein FACS189449_05530 [Alphaproteobacteria bacterium]|nr:hypothetical protein FACS189449_05530 [Alphaproteobacteria bacterium]
MVDRNSEMSLDEVLSSIKKMVIDEVPPVLELTDMVSSDGSIVKVKKSPTLGNKDPDMSSFLKLIQENTDSGSRKEPTPEIKKSFSDDVSDRISCSLSCEIPEKEEVAQSCKSEKNDILMEMVKETMISLIQRWLDENLRDIVKVVVEAEVRKLFEKR